MTWSQFFECWVLRQPFHYSSTFKRLFGNSLLSAMRVVSSAYLRLLIFLLAVLILAWDTSSPAFPIMYSAYKLNKQGDNIQPWHTPFPVHSSISGSVASWPSYRFLRRHIWWSGIHMSLRIFYSCDPHTESFSLWSRSGCFSGIPCFFYDPTDAGNLISGSVPLLNPACTSGSSQFMYCRSLAWRILSIILLACEMSAIVWWFEHSLALPFFSIGMKTDLLQSCGHCCFPNLLTCWQINSLIQI